jgi:3-hydroxyisobutyrate dehydrogenase-like beta-hydroxyacid dehydrogenase
METKPRVGFIGLGNMGRPMAGRLAAAGFPLLVHDVNRDAANQLLQAGALWGESPRSVAEEAMIICVSLPGPKESSSVFLGENGILSGAKSGSILIDFTTNSVSLVRKTHEALAQRGGAMLDAPVSGGVEAAKRGELTILAGGEQDVLERARSVLKHLAKTVIHIGRIGDASICKVLHNCAVFCSNLAMIECLTAGVKAGVDAATLIETFQKSGIGRNLDLHIAMPATLFRGNFSRRFAMTTAHKDMNLALELARDVGVPLQLAEMCEKQMAEAMKRGWGDKDNTVFLTLQEQRAGVQVRIPEQSS